MYIFNYVFKGKAVFWYNLNPDGNPCDETRHGACPVVIGDKYIANIWIREHGQEFTRPCNLDQKDTKYKWPKINIK
jgi:prolyl 4-hydroxylase